MKYNPYIIGLLRDDDGIEMNLIRCLLSIKDNVI